MTDHVDVSISGVNMIRISAPVHIQTWFGVYTMEHIIDITSEAAKELAGQINMLAHMSEQN